MKKLQIILLTLLVLVLAGCGYFRTEDKELIPGLDEGQEITEEAEDVEETDEEEAEEDVEEEESDIEETIEEVEVEVEEEVEVEVEEEPETSTSAELGEPQYLDVTSENYNEVKGSGAHVVFFHANWCPTCKALEADILGDLSSFPAGTRILKANYDTELELKSLYDVKFQSTLVVVNADGSKIVNLIAPDKQTLITTIEDSLK